MGSPKYPVVRLLLKPHFANGSATHIFITFTIPSIAVQGPGPILSYPTKAMNVPSHPYTETQVIATDEDGLVPFTFVSIKDSEQDWRPGRRIHGNLTLQMTVYPRKIDEHTAVGPRVDLRSDQGGLQGTGLWFLPHILHEGTFTNTVTWDLSEAPSGTRAVWTYGEGPGMIYKVGSADVLRSTVYMVGPIQSHPPGPIPGNTPGFCGCYWFGKLPANLDRLKNFNSELFKPLSEWFGHKQGTYRVFIRSAAIGYGGSGFDDSYVLEWDPLSASQTEFDLVHLFTHEATHSFVRMQSEHSEEEGWYVEGMAEFLASFLPYRFGLMPWSYVTTTLNGMLVSYHTNPEIHMSMEDSEKNFFDNWYAENIAYHRGFAYCVLIDSRLRKVAGVTDPKAPGPMGELVVELAKRSRAGQKVLRKDWLDGIGKWLSKQIDCEKELLGILDGDIVDLANATIASPDHQLVETQQRVLQFGFDRNALRSRVVGEVVPGSEAEMAGLRVGDHIVVNKSGNHVQLDPNETMFLIVRRGDEDVKVEWLPREKRKVPCWQLKV